MPIDPDGDSPHPTSKTSPSNPDVDAILSLMFPEKAIFDSWAIVMPVHGGGKPVHAKLDAQISAQRESLCALSASDLKKKRQQLEAERVAREKAKVAEKQVNAAAKIAAAESAKFYNLSTPDSVFDHWSKMESWTFDEAIALLLGKNPKVVTWRAMKGELGLSFTLGSLLNAGDHPPASDFVRRYENLRELAERASVMKAATLKPLNVLIWARKSGAIEPPQPLTRYVLALIPKVIADPQPVIGEPEKIDAVRVIEATGEGNPHAAKKWTAEKLAVLQARQLSHGTADAAKQAGISESRVKQLLMKTPIKKKGARSVFEWAGE